LTGAALALALLVASAALVPALSLMSLSERAGGLAIERAEIWSLHPVRLLEFVAPGALGNPSDARGYPGAAFVAEPGLGFTPWALSLYAGAAALLLAGLAGRGRVAVALWASAAVALALAFGRYLPVLGIASSLFPPLRYMRYPEKHVLVTIASLGWLGAIGAERIWRREAGLWRLAATGAGCAVLALVLAPEALRSHVRHGLFHFALAAVALAVAFLVSRRRPTWTWLIPAVAACDLVVAALPLLHWFNGSLIDRPPPIVAAIKRGTREAAPPRLYRPNEAGTRYDTLPHNLGLMFGVGHVPGHESALPVAFHRLWDRLSRSGPRALALLDANWAFLPDGSPPPAMVRVASEGGWQLLQAVQSARARLVHRAEVADDRTALARLADPQFDPATLALLASGSGAQSLDSSEAAELCTIDHFVRTAVGVHCASGAPGLLVLAEQFYPGWSATLDGRPVPVERVNLVMRGAFVPAGEHRIEFLFSPPALRQGLILSALGLLLCLALVLPKLVLRRR
jgi:hypothetical protein